MIKGMTGFGSKQISTSSVKMLIELRSINHRYLDINFYLPSGFACLENKITQIIKKDIKRGRITVTVKVIEKSSQAAVLNKDLVKRYIQYAKMIEREFGLKNDLTLSDIINMPGVLETKANLVSAETVWPALERGIKSALFGLLAMRRREGRSLASDVSKKLKEMIALVKDIRCRAEIVLKEKRKLFTDEEFKSFQKNIDVNEELCRLLHYISEAKLLLKSVSSVGKKLDFIAQEMQRESNTIGSKLQDKQVSSAVISIKSKVEKIREQAQNIE